MPETPTPGNAERTRVLEQAAARHSGAMVFLVEPGGQILYANDVACRALGLEADALAQRLVTEIDTDPAIRSGGLARRWEQLREQKVVVRLTEFVTASGRRIPVEVSSSYFGFDGQANILAVAHDVTERRRSDRLMRLMQVSIEQSGSAIFWITADGRFFYVNRHAWASLGYTEAELLSATVHDIAPDFTPDQLADRWERLRRVSAMTYETRHRRKDGTIFPVELSLNLVEYQGDEFVFARARDISERLRTAAALHESEERLRQAQKMEAIGRLAGGVAHDFNNLLTAILGYTELLLGEVREDDPKTPYVVEVRNAAVRATHLTRQLLAFSRKQVVQPALLDLNAVIAGFERMLRRLIPENVRLMIVPGARLGQVLADRVQIEQVVMNLAVNARDAMPEGGTLTIETTRVAAVGAGVEDPQGSLGPGEYIRLTITDTGVGMTDEVASHVFEPFFSTKGDENGTGLGLATVYGIVRQAGGHISVRTEVGRGTAFDIYLPRVAASAQEEAERASEEPVRAAGNEEVLVVEDDPLVRRFACEVLAKSGYQVIEASGPEHALALASRHRQHLDLLLTDLVMPGMNGRDLADRIRAQHPESAVLYMSGYADQVTITDEMLGPGTRFIQKPFTPDRLARAVRQVLSEKGRDPATE